MHSFQHGRVVISAAPLTELSVDALIVFRLADANGGDDLYEAVIAPGGQGLRDAVAEEVVAGHSALMVVTAGGLRADTLVIAHVAKDAQQGGAALEAVYERALYKALETGALTLGLPLVLGGRDDDAVSAIAVIAAFLEAHPTIEKLTLSVTDERATYRALAAAGEYL